MKTTTVAAATALLAALAAGCATTGDMRNTRGQGVTRYYETTFGALWSAAQHAVEANGLRTDDTSEYDRYIIATNPPDRGPRGFDDERVVVEADQGERVAVFIDSIAPRTWSVEVVTKRQFALDPGKTPWAKDIFWVIEQDLAEGARLEAEEALPDSAAGPGSPGSGGGPRRAPRPTGGGG